MTNYKTLLILILIIISLLTLSVIIISTSIFWIPILIINSPLILISYLIFRYLGLNEKLENYYFNVYDYMFYQSQETRKQLWKFMYNLMVYLYPQMKWRCMNYGYANLENENQNNFLNLQEQDIYERFPLQMYYHVATGHAKFKDLQNLTIIEVGSGRGGGLEFINRTLKPKQAFGIDFSQNQVDFCRQTCKSDNLLFLKGDSEKLDQIPELKGVEADLIINVESSHCYGNFEEFIHQVSKLLKKGAYFSISDFRAKNQELQLFEQQLQTSGLKIISKQDITPNILKALELDETRKINLIENNVHFGLRNFFKKFSGVQGSRINTEFKSGNSVYMAYLLQKE